MPTSAATAEEIGRRFSLRNRLDYRAKIGNSIHPWFRHTLAALRAVLLLGKPARFRPPANLFVSENTCPALKRAYENNPFHQEPALLLRLDANPFSDDERSCRRWLYDRLRIVSASRRYGGG